MKERPEENDKPPVGDTASFVTIALLLVCLAFLALILLLPAETLKTEAVYQGF